MTVLGSKFAQPPAPKLLVGEWLGFDEDYLRFCHLELDSNGTGLFAHEFTDDPPRLHLVTNWFLRGSNITIDSEPLDKDMYNIYLKGVAEHFDLHLEIGEPGKRWHRKLTLLNKRELLSKDRILREKIEDYKKWAR